MELIFGAGVHIFPRSPADWIEQATSHGAMLIGWFGQELLLPDRIFVHLAQSLRGGDGGHANAKTTPVNSGTRPESSLRNMYWRLDMSLRRSRPGLIR